MKKLILPHKLDLETLETALTQSDDNSIIAITNEYSSDIPEFLAKFNIEYGPYPLSNRLLYELYSLFSLTRPTRNFFTYSVGKYLPSTQQRGMAYYSANKTPLEIDQWIYRLRIENKVNKVKSPHYRNHFTSYLSYYKLKKGDKWVESGVLYHLYDLWSYKNKSKRPLGIRQFHSICKLYFPYKRRTTSNLEWFGTNLKIGKYLNKEELAQLTKGIRERHKSKGRSKEERQGSK